MTLSKEFYNQCCPSYQKAVNKLEKSIVDISLSNDSQEAKSHKIRAAVFNFSKYYLTPLEYWYLCLRLIDKKSFDNHENWRKSVCEIIKHAYFQHFFYGHIYDSFGYSEAYGNKIVQLLEFQNKYKYRLMNITEQDLNYPHDHLKKCFCKFEKKTFRLPPFKLVKRYEKMKELYSKIKSVEGNVDEWFKLLLEVGDNVFVKENVEYRLGRDFFNVKLWKLYIDFLKDSKEYPRLLEVYSKYCRFFLDDNEMLIKYKEEMIEHGYSDVPLDEIFECGFVSDEEKSSSVETKEILPFEKSICSSFYEKSRIQDFSLPKPLIAYILDNSDHRILRKLFSSCKYFYFKKQTPICYSFRTGSEIIFNAESLTLKPTSNQEFFFKDTFITGGIYLKYPFQPEVTFISNLIPRLYRCEAKYIKFYKQNMSFEELKFLIKHRGVVQLHLPNCKIMDEKENDFVSLEQIMAYLPNVKSVNTKKM
uniref:F-box domain-containing protein n=1 Tax=Panagrolaimus davidi TaxID=227884 RepID=A0A914NZI2_9BILA